MTHATPDVIDELVGIDPGSPLDAIRARRPAARENAQLSYLALFKPADPGSVSLAERFALAVFVTGLHGDAASTGHYRASLLDAGSYDLLEAIDGEAALAQTEGPYGHYPPGPLSSEDQPGLVYRVGSEGRRAPGGRLSAILEHAHLLVFRPRDATPDALQALLDAGLATTEIVTVSQIVAFLSFQIRVVHGLWALAAAEALTRPGYQILPAVAVAV